MTRLVDLQWIDYLVMLVYFAFVIGIGFALRRYMKTSTDFFLSGRSIPAWVAGLAFLSANLGAQGNEIVIAGEQKTTIFVLELA